MSFKLAAECLTRAKDALGDDSWNGVTTALASIEGARWTLGVDRLSGSEADRKVAQHVIVKLEIACWALAVKRDLRRCAQVLRDALQSLDEHMLGIDWAWNTIEQDLYRDKFADDLRHGMNREREQRAANGEDD